MVGFLTKGEMIMRNIRNARWVLGLFVAVSLMSLSSQSKASSTDTFNTSIDSGVWTTSISPTGNPGPTDFGTVAWDSGNVKVTQSTNLYANIRESIGPGVQSVSADINNVSDSGISWAPSMVLYYDASHWIQFGVSSVYGFLAQVDTGAGPSFAFPGYGQTQNTWDTLEIKLNPGTGNAEFYSGPQGGPLTHITLASNISGGTLQDTPVPSSFSTDSAYLILGKGYYSDSNGGFNPFFINDLSPAFNAPGNPGGVSLFDNAVVVTPEPASLGLLAAGGAILFGKRRSRARC